MYELALFAGAGGGILGGVLNGWRCIGAVECEGYPRGVLGARQNDGCLAAFPIWTDVRSFTQSNNACRRYIRMLRGVRKDLVISGGFPCQDISVAGKGAGITGERSGLWREFARIIGEIRPRHVLVENSPVLTSRGLGVVLGDLAALGYDARWGVLGAVDAGAPHKRERIWIVAHSAEHGWRARGKRGSDSGGEGKREQPFQTVADAARFQPGWENQRAEWERTGQGGEPAALENAFEGGCEMCLRQLGAAGSAGFAAEFSNSRSSTGPEKGDVDNTERNGWPARGNDHGRDDGDVFGAADQDAGDVANAEGIGKREPTDETNAESIGWEARAEPLLVGECDGDFPNPNPAGCAQQGREIADDVECGAAECGGEDGGGGRLTWWLAEPAVGRVAHGVAHRVDQLAALGNGQVPAVVRLAWETLA